MSTGYKKTRWFPGSVKPARVGVYQQKNPHGIIGYQRWDGAFWYCWAPSVDAAARSMCRAANSFQRDPWRGLASDPKGGAA